MTVIIIPGMPRTPLIIAVRGLIENITPSFDKIKFEASIAKLPIIQLSVNLKSHLIGFIKILHSMYRIKSDIIPIIIALGVVMFILLVFGVVLIINYIYYYKNYYNMFDKNMIKIYI